MAVLTYGNGGIDYAQISIHLGAFTKITSTEIELSAFDGWKVIANGAFTIVNGSVTGGTISQYYAYQADSSLYMSLTGLSMSLTTYEAYISANNILGLYSLALNGSDTINGGTGNDVFLSTAGNDVFQGGQGINRVDYSGQRSTYTVLRAQDGTFSLEKPDAQGSDTFHDVTRLKFSDTALAFDIGGNAGQAYRLYQAAFNRTPDKPGLGWQIKAIDGGATLKQISENFLNSAEFKALYGDNPSNSELVTLLYNNVLHRAPEQAGFDHWMNVLNTNQLTRAEVLYYFSESTENQVQVIGQIENGIEYQFFA